MPPVFADAAVSPPDDSDSLDSNVSPKNRPSGERGVSLPSPTIASRRKDFGDAAPQIGRLM